MRIAVERQSIRGAGPEGRRGCEIAFRLELDDDDRTVALSRNIDVEEIRLTGPRARVLLPVDVPLPHPDLVALCALKIAAPYIGSRLRLDRPVSERMAAAIQAAHPNIRHLDWRPDVAPRPAGPERPGIVFSGGVDSVAAALAIGPPAPLIQLQRLPHPALPGFEPGFRMELNLRMLWEMPEGFSRWPVWSDVPMLSTNGRYAVWADHYAFTIPALLLADELALSHLATGDNWATFTAEETAAPDWTVPDGALFAAAGLPLEAPIDGISKVGSIRLVSDELDPARVASCQYATLEARCMKCRKCLRAALVEDAVHGTDVFQRNRASFEGSARIKALATTRERARVKTLATTRWALDRLDLPPGDGPMSTVFRRAREVPFATDFADRYAPERYDDAALAARPAFVSRAARRIARRTRPMSPEERAAMDRLAEVLDIP